MRVGGFIPQMTSSFNDNNCLKSRPFFCFLMEKLVERECPDGANFGAMMSGFRVCSVGVGKVKPQHERSETRCLRLD